MSTRPDRRALLRDLYGFDFPEELFVFWDFATRIRPLEPLQALTEVIDLHLVGPFEVLAGRFDNRNPHCPMILHWRYHDDPPEFFTVMGGGTGGFHRGYYLDDLAATECCVASYYTNAAFEMHPEGDSLFEVVRLHLERRYRDCAEHRHNDPGDAFEREMTMRQIDEIRSRLMRLATRDRPESGADYEESYPERSTRSRRVVGATREGMGIVVPPATYRPFSLKDKALWRQLRKEEALADLVAEAEQALREGFPGTALKLGKDLWAIGGERQSKHAFELLDSAYTALGRTVIRDVLRAHRAHRKLASVDILENEMEFGSS
jgi:hypothetical protein